MSLRASFLLKADKRQGRKWSCLPDQDDGDAACLAWQFSCLAAKKDNGIKSSKMKRKRQIMLRDLNWISRRVCGSLCGRYNCRWHCRWPWSRCASLIASAGIDPRRALDSRVLTSIFSLDVLSHFFFLCRLLCFLFSISFCYVLYAWHNSPPSAYSSSHPQVFDGIHSICSFTADTHNRAAVLAFKEEQQKRKQRFMSTDGKDMGARPSNKCEMNLNEIFWETRVVSVIRCLQSFQSTYYTVLQSWWLQEITLNDEASQSFALSHDSPHYCEAVIPFYATLSRRTTEIRVFWSQECLETAHICLPVKTLIFNEPAKVTARTLMCCHPQQARSICQAVKLCLLLCASATRKHNQVILLFKVYTKNMPWNELGSCCSAFVNFFALM